MGKKFKDLKIGRKLLISYGAIIFLYIITVTASLLGIAKTSNTLDVFYQKAFAVSYTALDMKASVQGIGRCCHRRYGQGKGRKNCRGKGDGKHSC